MSNDSLIQEFNSLNSSMMTLQCEIRLAALKALEQNDVASFFELDAFAEKLGGQLAKVDALQRRFNDVDRLNKTLYLPENEKGGLKCNPVKTLFTQFTQLTKRW